MNQHNANPDPVGTSQHWSDEQFSSFAMGLTPELAASLHLQDCALCRTQLENFQQSVQAFSNASYDWARHRSSRMVVPAPRPTLEWLPTAAWALAAALAVGIGLPMTLHTDSFTPAQPVATSSQVASNVDENSAAAIERDNQLMMAVAQELDRNDAIPYQVPSSATPSKPAGRTSQD